MLNSDLYTILNKDPSTNHLIDVKRDSVNSVLLCDQTTGIVVPSVANGAKFNAFSKIDKPTFAFHAIVPNVGIDSYKDARLTFYC